MNARASHPTAPGGFVDPMPFDSSVHPDQADEDFPLVFQFNQSDEVSTEAAQLSGDVSAKRNSVHAFADEIRYERSTGEGQLNGQVRLRSLGTLITGDSAEINFDTDTASVDQAEFALHREDLHGSANTLYRENLNEFRGENISLTRCMPEDPAWGIQAATLRVNRETGIARAWHARFKIRSVPVLYVPYLSFPIDERRRSGFLPGTYGLGENGLNELAVPYYLNLAPNYDDTFTLHYFGELGLLARNEFRFLTDNHNGITDLDVQLTQEAETTDGESAPRRWAYRQRLSGQLGEDTGYDLDTRWVSDVQYDQNFNNGGDTVDDQTLDLTLRQRIPTGTLTLDNEFTTPVRDSSSNFHTATVQASTRFGDLRTRLLTEVQLPENDGFVPDEPLDKEDWPLQTPARAGAELPATGAAGLAGAILATDRQPLQPPADPRSVRQPGSARRERCQPARRRQSDRPTVFPCRPRLSAGGRMGLPETAAGWLLSRLQPEQRPGFRFQLRRGRFRTSARRHQWPLHTRQPAGRGKTLRHRQRHHRAFGRTAAALHLYALRRPERAAQPQHRGGRQRLQAVHHQPFQRPGPHRRHEPAEPGAGFALSRQPQR